MKRINAIVFKPADRPFFHAQWLDHDARERRRGPFGVATEFVSRPDSIFVAAVRNEIHRMRRNLKPAA
jgi:hypothetical protein